MKIGLASYRCENKNIEFNISRIERAMRKVQGKADLLCFGEAFLQGFDSLSLRYRGRAYCHGGVGYGKKND